MQANYDAAWHCRALAGDPAAVRLLAEQALQPLFRFCLHRLGRNHTLSEDVVQETLLRAIRDLDQYDPARAGNNIFRWLSGLARNEIRRALAREKNGTTVEALWLRVDGELAAFYARHVPAARGLSRNRHRRPAG